MLLYGNFQIPVLILSFLYIVHFGCCDIIELWFVCGTLCYLSDEF